MMVAGFFHYHTLDSSLLSSCVPATVLCDGLEVTHQPGGGQFGLSECLQPSSDIRLFGDGLCAA